MRKARAFVAALASLSLIAIPLGEALAQNNPARIGTNVDRPGIKNPVSPRVGPRVGSAKPGVGSGMPRGGGMRDPMGHRGPGLGPVLGGVAIGIATGILLSQPPAVAAPQESSPQQPQRSNRNTQQQRAARASGVPPAGETRMVPDEVVIEIPNTVSQQAINTVQQRHRLTPLGSQAVELTGTTFYRWRITDRRSVPNVIRALEADGRVASAQPNYLYSLQQQKPVTEATALPADPVKLPGAEITIAPKYDPAQYAVAKMRLLEAHGIAKGNDVLVAVIDSGVDSTHPELAGAVAGSFDTIQTPFRAHEHGTAIAALIAGRERLMGSSPGAKILAVRAFDPGADATTFNIIRGLDWSASHGARVINMSFAGPADPAIARSLAAAHKKGVVLVAAAGNAGAKSAPLYPAADPNVIAVTATDSTDKLFDGSNRGRHIAVAAPGVDVLVAVPNGGYIVSTGTSYSAAEVSGIVALMLQYRGALTPDQVRDTLLSTAKDLGPAGRDDDYGAGLTDAYRALTDGMKTSAAAPK
jgi:hypothetical protein